MKKSYAKHQYSGSRPNLKRSRAAMLHYHGVAKRQDAWRQGNVENVQSASTSSAHTTVPRVYTRKRHQVPTEAQSLNVLSSPDKEICQMPTTSNINWPPADLESGNHNLTVEVSNHDYLDGLHSYRIIDIHHVLKWALSLQADHCAICTLGKVQFVSEVQHRLNSIFKFECTMCSRTWAKTSEPHNKKINDAFVWGALTSGSHFSQANHILSVVDIPAMSSKTFRKTEVSLGKVWEDHLFMEMYEAGAREKAIAIEKGNVCPDGVPYVTVYVDGGWSKRSYGHNFNAASGAACIIGKETHKCLFLGVRNKYCHSCQYHSKNKIPPKQHDCWKNYDGSSTGMEADIIVEGFRRSEEMHGIRYLEFIGDGDSSVYARLRENVVYGSQIKKLECKNHVIKNYTSALYKIVNNTKLPISGRKLLKERIGKLTAFARKNIIYNSVNGSVTELRRDLHNGPLHLFGQHDNCLPYYCKFKKAELAGEAMEFDKDVIQNCGIVFTLISAAVDLIIKKADRLHHNETNNWAENFMSLIAKFNCGKRIDLTKSGSYQRRVQIAGLSQLTGHKWHLKAWKTATTISPGKQFKKYLLQKENSRKIRKKTLRAKKIISKSAQKADKDYGPQADDPPPQMTKEMLNKLCEEKIKEFQLPIEKIQYIEKESVGQHGNLVYDTYRENRLTASLFGMICKRRASTPCHNHVKAVLYKSNFKSEDTTYGAKNEVVAIKIFEEQYRKKVRSAGLYIDAEFGFLGASPDEIVLGENSVVEVKCFPSLIRSGEKIEDAAKKSDFPFNLVGGSLVINKAHSYYYQIQGQLRIVNADLCYFIGYINETNPLTVVTVEKDNEFIEQILLPILVNFFESCVLPEKILRRVPANLKCLDSQEISQARKNIEKKKQ